MKRIALAAALASVATIASAQQVVEYYYVTTDTAPRYYYYYEAAPPVTVYAPRYYDEDDRITADVVDTLAYDPRLSGRIGVDSYNGRVQLTGRVATPGQMRIAQQDAMSVPGVREVSNELRPRVGGSY